MPKQNKKRSRRIRRQCAEADNEAATSSATLSSKPVIRSNRYNPFPRRIATKDPVTKQETMIMPSIEAFQSTSGGIIENGIRYVMFPLHLLRFCIFGSNSRSVTADNLLIETKQTGSSNGNDERRETEQETKVSEERSTPNEASNDRSSKELHRMSPFYLANEHKDTPSCENNSKEENNSDCEESVDEMLTAEEDCDSSAEQWCTASSSMMMPVDHNNIDKCTYEDLEEPMDISIEEQLSDKTSPAIKISQDNRSSEYFRCNAIEDSPKLPYFYDQDSNSSVDEEVARIFQKHPISPENELPSTSRSYSARKHEKTGESNFIRDRINDNHSAPVSGSKKDLQSNQKERKKKTSPEFITNSNRRKATTQNEDKYEKQRERKTESKTREEKRSSRQDLTPCHYRLRSSRTSVKSRESKRKDIRYKETATQTDSAFSDDDVEMIPVDAKLYEKQSSCKRVARKLQFNFVEEKPAKQESRCVTDNEDSINGVSRITHKRASSSSTSSSSTDLGFDEHTSTSSDVGTSTKRLQRNSLGSTNNSIQTCTRAPPGFPKLPQNPPLTSYSSDDFEQFTSTDSKHDCSNSLLVPPAPSPMRHLYYNYPEFMNVPANVNSSKILNDILKNNYYR